MPMAGELLSIFNDYANPANRSRLTLHGVIAFFSELQLDVETDPLVLFIAYKMHCQCMYIVTQRDIQSLKREYGISTFEKLREQLPQWRREMDEERVFKDFYQYLFMYAVRAQPDAARKRLHCHSACALWEVLLGQRVPDLQRWIDYVRRVRGDVEGVSRDEWNMSLALFRNASLDKDAWPLLISNYIRE